ncbi:MAG: hypothetical protein MJ192_10220 [Clostridia bacterium]|nr:hypothetical protein [Clostridia bacterium]
MMENDRLTGTADEKKRRLYFEQKRTLELFLERGAITKAQYDKSLGDLTVKMGMRDEPPCGSDAERKEK